MTDRNIDILVIGAGPAGLEEIQSFMKIIRSGQAAGLEYSDNLWIGLIDHVTVYEDERLVFAFKNGKEITEQL